MYSYGPHIEEALSAPMPWIGLYVAAASLVCTVAMAGDVIHGIWRRKFWFPCKFFPINATSLTLLAVAMKLPMDLTTPMLGLDAFAKIGSEAFMTIVMGNFLISVASRNNDQTLMNSMALGILVVTIVVDVVIQQLTWSSLDVFGAPYYIFSTLYIVSMLGLLVILSSLALTNPTTKRYMEVQYNNLHETSCEGGKLEEIGKLTHHKLKEEVEKYWVMAETGSPQFVMARSVTSVTSGAICLVSAIPILILVVFFGLQSRSRVLGGITCYRWSTIWILSIQSIGVVVGIIAPLCRWITVVTINCNNIFTNHHHHKEFKLVEYFWIQRLVEWKETPLPSQIRGVKCKMVLTNLKLLFLNLCIFAQIGIVVANKLVQLISIIIVLPFFSCFYYYKKKMKKGITSDSSASTNDKSSKSRNSSLELDPYVLQLEGEAKLPKIILKNICHELLQVIERGKSGQPKHLVKLLQRSNNSYKGVAKFESGRVSGGWTMPVVNLTCIAIALPNTENHVIDELISSVSEGLLYASLVEESFISEEEHLLNMKRAAAVVWADVELYGKWLDKDLRQLPPEGKTIKGTLQTLVGISEKAVIEFQSRAAKGPKALAANSMYEISQTILKDYEGGMDAHEDGHLFEQLSVMIADILRACLSNLPRVIIQKCYCIPIEEREKSVRRAAHLLGETEEILKILGQHPLPCSSEDQAKDTEEGHHDMMQKETPAVVPSSNNEIVVSGSGEVHIDVDE